MIKRKLPTRNLVVSAMLGALAAVLMALNFAVPFMPGFIKFDFSDLPALIASFCFGPVYGAGVCLLKNIIDAFTSSSAGVGQISNFILGAAFVVPAGIIYKTNKTRKGALLGALVGSLASAIISLPVNYFIVYPIYQKLFMPLDKIVSMYQSIFHGVDSLLDCLLLFNVPFTFLKGLVSSIITFIIYKRISPILKGAK